MAAPTATATRTIPMEHPAARLAGKRYHIGCPKDGSIHCTSHSRPGVCYVINERGGRLVHAEGLGSGVVCQGYANHGYCTHLLKVAQWLEAHTPQPWQNIGLWEATRNDPYRMFVRGRSEIDDIAEEREAYFAYRTAKWLEGLEGEIREYAYCLEERDDNTPLMALAPSAVPALAAVPDREIGRSYEIPVGGRLVELFDYSR